MRSFQILTSAVLLTLLLFTLASAQNKTTDASLERIAVLIQEKKLAEAEQQLATILKTSGDQPLALNLLGTIRAQQDRLDDAERLFTRAIKLDEQLVGPRLNLAYLYLLKRDEPKATAQLTQVLKIEPSNAKATEQLASRLFAQGDIDNGIKLVEQSELAGLDPASLTPSFLVSLGDAYLKKRNAPGAEKSFRQALLQENENADAVLGLAQAQQLKGDNQAALTYLSRARQLPINSPDTLYRFGLVSLGAGRYEEANTALSAAIKLKPTDAAYFVALGNTWVKKPDLIEAEQAFRRALQLQPNNPQAQMSLGYALLEQKKYPEAKEWLEKSLQKDPTVPETSYYLGLIFQEESDDARAIELFKKAIELVPKFSFPHTALGMSYLKMKNYQLAKEELELSVKLNPNDPAPHYNLAVLYARLKDPERAQQEMQIVEKLKNAGKQAKQDNSVSPDR